MKYILLDKDQNTPLNRKDHSGSFSQIVCLKMWSARTLSIYPFKSASLILFQEHISIQTEDCNIYYS
jgi:hypothetical protein